MYKKSISKHLHNYFGFGSEEDKKLNDHLYFFMKTVDFQENLELPLLCCFFRPNYFFDVSFDRKRVTVVGIIISILESKMLYTVFR